MVLSLFNIILSAYNHNTEAIFAWVCALLWCINCTIVEYIYKD